MLMFDLPLTPETHKGLKRVTLICLLCPMLVGRHLIPSTKLTSSSHKTFHFSYMKVLDEMFIKVKVSSIFKEKNNSG